MGPFTITVQGFGDAAEAAAAFELISELIENRNVPARCSLNVKRETEKAAMYRYERRMAELSR